MLKVICALIEQHGRVLITQRSESMPEALLWEFPGGKLEAGETEEECIVREIREELDISITPETRLKPVIHSLSPGKCLELVPYLCQYNGGTIYLKEHKTYNWVSAHELKGYTWCPPDLPIVEEYLQLRS